MIGEKQITKSANLFYVKKIAKRATIMLKVFAAVVDIGKNVSACVSPLSLSTCSPTIY